MLAHPECRIRRQQRILHRLAQDRAECAQHALE
jgi:hypothetical protein